MSNLILSGITVGKKITNTQLNFIDVFSGAGGLSCGMEQAGWRCLLGIDHDRYAIKTFAHNHKFASTYGGDVEKLTTVELKKLVGDQTIHAIVGGPPCQGFSTVGRGDPADIRNRLFMHFVRLVKTLNPYYIVIENVTGLLAKKNEKTLKAILAQFTVLGYNLNVQVMSAHKYGVPEKRRRTIILGSRINSQVEFPLPLNDVEIDGHFIGPVTVGDAFKDLDQFQGPLLNHDVPSAAVKNKLEFNRLKRIPEGKGIRYQHDEKAYLPPSLRLGVDWKKLKENRFRQTKYQRLDSKLPSPTIMTHRHNYYHPTENRFLTQREAARLQSFPNDFEFLGPLSAQWRQIGNAVPPLLGKAIGQKLLELFKQAQEQKNKGGPKSKRTDIKEIRKSAFHYKPKKKTDPKELSLN